MSLIQQIPSVTYRKVPILVIVLALALLPPHASPIIAEQARASPPVSLSPVSRVPGVVAGNNATYATSLSWQTNNPAVFPDPFNGASLYSSVMDSVLQVTIVSGSNVTSTTTLDYRNGTASSFITENVDVATQNVCFMSPLNPSGKYCSLGDPRLPAPFIASGLQAPDPIGSSPKVTLNQTATIQILGNQLTVNMFNLTIIDTPSYCLYIQGTPCPNTTVLGMSWDQSSGMMIDDSITELYSSSSGSAIGRFSLEMVSTNTWPTITPATTMTLSCDPQTIYAGLFATCTVTVTPTPPSVTFSVSTSSQTGFFNPYGSSHGGICRLMNGKCSLIYTDPSPDNTTASIIAVLPSSRVVESITTITIIRPSNIIRLETSIETVHAGSTAANHATYTGLTVNVTGSSVPDGTNVLVTTETLSLPYEFSNPPDYISGGVPLSSAKFYFVAVNGLASGTARICAEYPGTGSMTTMRYGYSGDPAHWANATDLKANGAFLCGDMPARILSGEHVAVGNILETNSPQPLLPDSLLLQIAVAVPIGLIISGAIVVMRSRKRQALRGSAKNLPT